jgi:hypothetical protein
MTAFRSLLVADAHFLDLLTFLLALSVFGIAGEANGPMRVVYAQGGVSAVIALKLSGTAALSLFTFKWRWAFILAASSGLIGAAVNIWALSLA